jgi:hypothetical protein
MLSWPEAILATLGDRFMRSWIVVERAYRRPMSAFAFRIKFAFYPLLALVALAQSGFTFLIRLLLPTRHRANVH